MDSNEGIVIVPINFLSAENSRYIREMFFGKFVIERASYFAGQVFADTTANVMAFYYKRKEQETDKMTFPFTTYPQGVCFAITAIKKPFGNFAKQHTGICRNIELRKQYGWRIEGENIARMEAPNILGIRRLLETDLKPGGIKVKCACNSLDCPKEYSVDEETRDMLKRNIVVLKAVDTRYSRLCLVDIREYEYDGLVGLSTSRNQMQAIFPKKVNIGMQEELIKAFNAEINKMRDIGDSLFITNFYDGNRKRISFSNVYGLLNSLFSILPRG